MQIEKIKTKQEVNKKEQAVIDTLQLTSEVCTQRSFSGLFKKICEFMPKYFGFEAVGALVFNHESKSIHWQQLLIYTCSLLNMYAL